MTPPNSGYRGLCLRGLRHRLLGPPCGQASTYFPGSGREEHDEQECRRHQRLGGRKSGFGWSGSYHRDPKRGRRDSKNRDSPQNKETKIEVKSEKTEQQAAKSEHPKKWGAHYITDYDGDEICFKFAKGKAGDCGDE